MDHISERIASRIMAERIVSRMAYGSQPPKNMKKEQAEKYLKDHPGSHYTLSDLVKDEEAGSKDNASGAKATNVEGKGLSGINKPKAPKK